MKTCPISGCRHPLDTYDDLDEFDSHVILGHGGVIGYGGISDSDLIHLLIQALWEQTDYDRAKIMKCQYLLDDYTPCDLPTDKIHPHTEGPLCPRHFEIVSKMIAEDEKQHREAIKRSFENEKEKTSS
jgi:hypothetical protein